MTSPNKYFNILLFGSWNGIKFDDNSKALFDYVDYNFPEVKKIIIVNDESNIDLKYKKFTHSKYSLYGIYYQLIGGFYFFTHGYQDFSLFSYFFSSRKIYFQLYHGIPIKVNKHKMNLYQEFLLNLLMLAIGRRGFDYFLSTSDFSSGLFDLFFGEDIHYSNYKVLGYPRNDVLFKNSSIDKKILYIPTFRPYVESSSFARNKEKLDLLNGKLQKLNYTLFLKLHPVDISRFNLEKDFAYSHIRIIHDIDFDLYKFLGEVSILITDYSSAYFDFLLLDRPIIFFPYDYEKYQKEVGFTMDYYKSTPGMKVYNIDDLGDAIEETIECDRYKDERFRMKNLIHTYQDGNSSERIYKFISNLVGKK